MSLRQPTTNKGMLHELFELFRKPYDEQPEFEVMKWILSLIPKLGIDVNALPRVRQEIKKGRRQRAQETKDDEWREIC